MQPSRVFIMGSDVVDPVANDAVVETNGRLAAILNHRVDTVTVTVTHAAERSEHEPV